MNPIIKRLSVAFTGALGALIASLSSMDGGMQLTFSQLGQVPLVAWLGVVMAFVTGYLNGENIAAPKALVGLLLVGALLPALMITPGCATTDRAPQSFSEQVHSAKTLLDTAYKLAAAANDAGSLTGKAYIDTAFNLNDLGSALKTIELGVSVIIDGEELTPEKAVPVIVNLLNRRIQELEAKQKGGNP